jgi:Holliday junction resolvasome RuvABC endonuclease subunit
MKEKKKQLRILAIDPAEKTGFATSSGLYGVWDFKLKRDEAGFGIKLMRFNNNIEEIVKKEKIEYIVYERPSGFHANAVISHSKFVGVIEKFGIENDIPTRGFSASEIKKFATGKGNANKKLMVQAAIKKLGYRGADDNVADAMWIRELAINELN